MYISEDMRKESEEWLDEFKNELKGEFRVISTLPMFLFGLFFTVCFYIIAIAPDSTRIVMLVLLSVFSLAQLIIALKWFEFIDKMQKSIIDSIDDYTNEEE